jgi:hypothetical protein
LFFIIYFLLASIHYLSKPSSYKKTILDPLWQQAIDKELSTLQKINTRDLIPLPLGKIVISYR